MGWLKKLFKPEVKYLILEVEKPRALAQLDPEGKKSVRSLAGHPGFLYLIEKLKIQRAQIRTALENSRTDENDSFLKNGIYWTGWLEQQFHKELYDAPARRAAEPTLEEQAILEQAKANLELVGVE